MTRMLDQSARCDARKRKTHKKSRNGCGNCKLRRVKCDESQPACQKCLAYGVSCNYDTDASNPLQLSGEGTIRVNETSDTYRPPCMPGAIVLHRYSGISAAPVHDISLEDLDILLRFQNKTVLTIGNASANGIYRQEIPRMAVQTPFLRHVVATLTLMHERLTADTPKMKPSAAEAFHWYKGTSLLNKTLSRRVRVTDKDAIWASAALIGAVVFATVEARGPEDMWPLSAPSPVDLEWLKLSEGKKAIFRLASDFRPDSIFSHYIQDHITEAQAISALNLNVDVLHVAFIDLFELTDPSIKDRSPYYQPLRVLSYLIPMEVDHHNILKFLSFLGHLDLEFRKLLETKEPKALMLLAWWFALMCPYQQWWVQQRVVVACQAICLYFERHIPHDRTYTELLRFPRNMCGLTAATHLQSYGIDNSWATVPHELTWPAIYSTGKSNISLQSLDRLNIVLPVQ